MELRLLGSHGLLLSSIGLGTRTWGLDTDSHEAAEMFARYREAGGNVLDVEADPRYPEPLQTAGELTAGTTGVELILRSGAFPGLSGPDSLPSRATLLDSLDASLAALGADHVSLWLLSGPRGPVPLEELLSAADLAWRTGKARYVGIGNLPWWDVGAATYGRGQPAAPLSAWTGPVSLLEPGLLQNQAAPLRESGLGIIAGAPLAGGLLTGKYRHSTPPDARATSPRFQSEFTPYEDPITRSVIEAVWKAAEGLDRSAAEVALVWARDLPGVTSTIVGPRNTRQLQHLLQVANWKLPSALREVLSEVALRD